MISTFEGHTPQIGPDSYVHPSADVLGHVRLGAGCWVGPGARLRGDYGRIEIGDNTSVEDNCVIHARPGERTVIGRWVTVGHGAIIHNATVNDWALVGMGSIVMNGARIGRGSIVGAGAVITEGKQFPEHSLIIGAPARVIRTLEPAQVAAMGSAAKFYVANGPRFKKGLTKIG